MTQIKLTKQLGALKLAVDVELPPQGLTVFFGPSGSGKTSVVNLMSGLMKPDAGYIKVGDHVLFDSEKKFSVPPFKRRIGYIFQEARLFPHLTVRANLNYGYSDGLQIRFDEVVELLGIEHLLARRPHHLSGGEKQRVAIGRSLLTNPNLLLMDEPLSALDELRKEEIIPFIIRVRDEFFTPIIYVTHAMKEVERLANTIVVMKNGEATHHGPQSEILPVLQSARLENVAA
ncbi:MAG: molybdenum ABC transporter ATP-binding protein [Rhodospirillaceae bacterium]|nr:molybdenum ABC transporter ATP-binding protein [Rhodospirillaceae bacterium]